MNEHGHVRLSLKTFSGDASLYLDKAMTDKLSSPMPFLTLLCELHCHILHYTGASRESYPELALHLENFSSHPAFEYEGKIAFSEGRLIQTIDAWKQDRIGLTLLHESGHIVQRLLGLSVQTAWPGFIEGLASILGLQLCNMMYTLPADRNGDHVSFDQLAERHIQNGLRHITDGRMGKLGLFDYTHGPAPQILEAALFDLVYNHVRSAKPLHDAIHVLAQYAKAGKTGTFLQNFETFFEAFGTSAGLNISNYLRAWKFELDTLPASLTHLPALDAGLPAKIDPQPSIAKAPADAQQHTYGRRPETSFSQVGVEAVSIAFGPDIALKLIAPEQTEAVLDRFEDLRNELARETGIVAPGIHVRDDIYLKPNAYAIYVRGNAVATGELRHDEMLALGKDHVLAELQGDDTHEPVYGHAAKWIPAADKTRARLIGAQVFDPLSVVVSHTGQIVRNHFSLLLRRQEFNAHLEHLRSKAPALMKDLDAQLPAYAMHKALRLLLREHVWPRDLILTFETFLDTAQTSKDPIALAEAARKHLVPAQLRRAKSKTLKIVMFSPDFEIECSAADGGLAFFANEASASYVKEKLTVFAAKDSKKPVVVLCTSPLRMAFVEFVLRKNLNVNVYAFNEIPTEFDVTPVGVIFKPAVESAVTANRSTLEDRLEVLFSKAGVEVISIALGPETPLDLLDRDVAVTVVDRMKLLRNEIARETGIVIPNTGMYTDSTVEPYTYVIRIHGRAVATGEIRRMAVLALGDENMLAALTGNDTREPVYGYAAKWIPQEDVTHARSIGVMICDPLSLLTSHLGLVARVHLSLLYNRQEFEAHTEHLRNNVPALIKDLEEQLPANALHEALRLLLREHVWPRDLRHTFESFLHTAKTSKDTIELAEAARKHLVPAQFRYNKQKVLEAVFISPEFESAYAIAGNGFRIPADTNTIDYVKQQVEAFAVVFPELPSRRGAFVGFNPVVICSPKFRFTFADFLIRANIKAKVCAFDEIPSEIEIQKKGAITLPDDSPAAA